MIDDGGMFVSAWEVFWNYIKVVLEVLSEVFLLDLGRHSGDIWDLFGKYLIA